MKSTEIGNCQPQITRFVAELQCPLLRPKRDECAPELTRKAPLYCSPVGIKPATRSPPTASPQVHAITVGRRNAIVSASGQYHLFCQISIESIFSPGSTGRS